MTITMNVSKGKIQMEIVIMTIQELLNQIVKNSKIILSVVPIFSTMMIMNVDNDCLIGIPTSLRGCAGNGTRTWRSMSKADTSSLSELHGATKTHKIWMVGIRTGSTTAMDCQRTIGMNKKTGRTITSAWQTFRITNVVAIGPTYTERTLKPGSSSTMDISHPTGTGNSWNIVLLALIEHQMIGHFLSV